MKKEFHILGKRNGVNHITTLSANEAVYDAAVRRTIN